MRNGRMTRLIIRSSALFFLLATVIGLQAQSYTVYPLRDASGSILNCGSGDDYDLLADGSGNLHLLWSENGYVYYGRVIYSATSGQYYLAGQEYTGVNFYIDGISGLWTQPRVCVRRDGQTVHFVWGEALKHAWRNAQGVWSKETLRSISGVQRCIAPSVVVEDNETVHVLYGYYDGSNGDDATHLIYQRKPAGGSWSGAMEFDVAGYNDGAEWRDPVMTLDAQGGIHATWCNYMYWTTDDGGAARYRYAPAGTGLEAASTVIIPRASGVDTNGAGNIFVDSSGKVHRTMSTSLISIDYSSKPSGASGAWATPSRPSNGLLQTGEDSWAGVTTDSCGRVLVAYGDGANYTNYPYLYLSVLDQGAWTPYTISSSAGLGCFRQPSLVAGSGMLFLLWRQSSGQLYLATTPDSCGSLTVTSPNGGEIWTGNDSRIITWSSTGAVGNVNIDCSTTNGSTWYPVAINTENDGSFTWTVPNAPSTSCLVRVQEVDGSPTDTSDAVFTILAYSTETISAPTIPTGPAAGTIGASYPYASGGSISDLGHDVQYKFDWGDGTDSGWLAVGSATASHIWAAAGTYSVRTMARCATHTASESLWSAACAILISGGGTENKYNSPSQYKVLPEVIWAPAAGGGTWVSDVQVTDMTGGSRVAIFYNTASGRRGPFLLWDNSSGNALSSKKFDNLLATIDNLDTGTFTYYGTVGAVEFITQDGSHTIHVAVRELNGNCAKTFTALSLHDANTATTSRAMIIPNLTNNISYRSTCGFFNPTVDAVTLELKLFNAANAQVGSTIIRMLAGHDFQAFNPFTQAGVPYPDTASDSIVLHVTPTSGSGKVMCFGATANNTTNDPAAHVAVQSVSGLGNEPSPLQVMPEAIWALATGGGTWMSEMQIVDITGGSQVSVYFDYGGGNRRGPFALWTGGATGAKMKYANMLQTIDGLDAGAFDYYGKVGAVEFFTQDSSHYIYVTAREVNGNYSKTFPGLNLADPETADTSRTMLVQNITNNATYRTTCGFYNPLADAVTVEYTLLNANGGQIGTTFSRTLAGYDFQAFNPFTLANVPYPENSYDNVILRVRPTSGRGTVMSFGATANNTSNDPASHLAVQAE
ncbi:MAG: hypothetical protein PHX05_02280 [Acidobacteriota bacterium]|nr:hypothetical protein [Acidobacteriota bacterium]